MTPDIKASSDELIHLGWKSIIQRRASGWQVVAIRHAESLMVIGSDLQVALDNLVRAARSKLHVSPAPVVCAPRATAAEITAAEIDQLLARARNAGMEASRVKSQADAEIAASRAVIESYNRSRAKRAA